VIANEDFIVEYNSAVKNYISTRGEMELHRAYELGRKALETGKLIIYATQVHSEIVRKIFFETADPDKQKLIFTAVTEFFSEFLSPFEMTFKGFMDVVENLKTEIVVRQNAEEAYKQSERYYKALIGNALDIITILDANGTMKYYNSAVEKVLGYSMDELLGKNAFSFVHPDDVDSVLEIFTKTASIRDYTTTAEFRFLHKNGQWVILESIGKNLLDDPVINGIIVNSRDITDRRNLEESRRKYEFIANASKELMGIVNRNYLYEAVNDSFSNAMSLNKSDIVGKHIASILGEDIFYKMIKTKLDKAFDGNTVIYEDWFNLPGNGKRFVEVAYYPYRNKSSVVTHIVIVQRDITERKKREDEIKKSQLQLTEAQSIAHLGSWEWVAVTDMVYCSEEIRNIFGLKSEVYKIQFKEFMKFISPEERNEFQKAFKSALENNASFSIVHKIIRTNNEIRILQTRVKASHETTDFTLRMIGTSQDVTEQELARQSIKASEIKYRRLFETSKEGILLLDGSTGIINDLNPFITDYLGYPKEDFISRKLWELSAVKGLPETEKIFKDIIAKEYARYAELDLVSSEGKLLKVEFISIAYLVNSHKVIQCHIWDITERKMLLQEINRAAKQRAEDMRNFANSIQAAQEEERRRISRELHDDICQRLTALKFHLNIFEDAVQNQKKISLRRLRSVKKEIDNLISEVRTISSNLRPSALDHFGLVTAMRLLCTEFKKLHGIETNFDTNIATFRRYNPDVEIAFYRITQEAFSNCAKHTKVKELFIKITEENSRLNLVVKDKGAGFNPADFIKHTEKESGHFGLINMRERTELMGGIFNINSARGKGTTVSVIVPLTEVIKDEKN